VSERPFSVTKVISGIGGLLLVAAFLLPVVDVKGGGAAAGDLFGIRQMRREIERSRELEAAKPLIEPALKQLDAFADSPSLRNLAAVIGTTKEIVDTAAGAKMLPPEARDASTVLGASRAALWLVPLVGVVQTVLPLLSRFRGYAGFLGLVARFAFGLLFVLLALTPLLGAPPAAQPYIGSAVYAALIGGALMVAGGVGGVTRGNFVFVLLAQAGILAVVFYGLKTVAEMART
jgi:hypothetical protein